MRLPKEERVGSSIAVSLPPIGESMPSTGASLHDLHPRDARATLPFEPMTWVLIATTACSSPDADHAPPSTTPDTVDTSAEVHTGGDPTGGVDDSGDTDAPPAIGQPRRSPPFPSRVGWDWCLTSADRTTRCFHETLDEVDAAICRPARYDPACDAWSMRPTWSAVPLIGVAENFQAGFAFYGVDAAGVVRRRFLQRAERTDPWIVDDRTYTGLASRAVDVAAGLSGEVHALLEDGSIVPLTESETWPHPRPHFLFPEDRRFSLLTGGSNDGSGMCALTVEGEVLCDWRIQASLLRTLREPVGRIVDVGLGGGVGCVVD